MSDKPQFGPVDAEIFTDYQKWADRCKELGYRLIPATSGDVAHNQNHTCAGAWFTKSKKGWVAA